MHIYFSGIGGTGIGPLALIAHQAGYTVSGSDKSESQYTEYLQQHGITLHIGQDRAQINAVHKELPIDWIVVSSAVPLENPHHDELVYAQENNIKISKRDELLNEVLKEKNLELLAVAGTHGKTTSTAMLIWGAQKLGISVSYSVGAKISFGDMGRYDPASKYFIYECDEFDRNFLQFNPKISGITTIDWDHHDIYPTREDYKDAFRKFITASQKSVLFTKDLEYIELESSPTLTCLSENDDVMEKITLHGHHNRRNALIAAHILQKISDAKLDEIIEILNEFPGTQRRFEKIAENIYSDYAHTPEEISATLQLAKELNNTVVVVYEPQTNKRQHFMLEQYGNIFESASKVYWTPSYLAREDPNQHVLTPSELIAKLSSSTNAVPAELNEELLARIKEHAASGTLVICMAGGGGGSLDEYLRVNLKVQ